MTGSAGRSRARLYPPTRVERPGPDPSAGRLGRGWLVAAVGLSAVGGWFHNTQEGITTLAPETLSALLVAFGLGMWWWWRPSRSAWWATLIWVAALNVGVGAVLSVLPLPIWPFVPEQSLAHYVVHLVYLLMQLPALYALWLTRPRSTAADTDG